MKCEPHFASWQTCFKVLLCLSYFTNWNSCFQVFWHPLLTWHRSKPFAFSIGLLISFDLAFSLQFLLFFIYLEVCFRSMVKVRSACVREIFTSCHLRSSSLSPRGLEISDSPAPKLMWTWKKEKYKFRKLFCITNVFFLSLLSTWLLNSFLKIYWLDNVLVKSVKSFQFFAKVWFL